MKHVTVMVMRSIFKELFKKNVRRTIYSSVQTFYIERFTVCFINNQRKKTKLVGSPDITLCG